MRYLSSLVFLAFVSLSACAAFKPIAPPNIVNGMTDVQLMQEMKEHGFYPSRVSTMGANMESFWKNPFQPYPQDSFLVEEGIDPETGNVVITDVVHTVGD